MGKLPPENVQKAGKAAKVSTPATQPASTKVHGVTAKDLVGKTIRVEFGDDGERFDGMVMTSPRAASLRGALASAARRSDSTLAEPITLQL